MTKRKELLMMKLNIQDVTGEVLHGSLRGVLQI